MVKTKYKDHKHRHAFVHVERTEAPTEQEKPYVEIACTILAVIGTVLFTFTARGSLDVLYGGLGLLVAVISIMVVAVKNGLKKEVITDGVHIHQDVQ